MTYIKVPMAIENKSFEMIEEEMGAHDFTPEELQVVKRVIHTTADFDYGNIIYISPEAIKQGVDALAKGAKIYTDTNMALAGINKKALANLGCEAICYVNDEDVRKEAKKRNITRSIVGVEKAVREGFNFFVFGNAPTALFTLKELTQAGKAHPDFIVGAPVGFVGAKESKEEIKELSVPMITIRGRKGGSNVSAAIVNALLYMVTNRE
ncbi:MAG TPA: precorrin-8X methylmutase [Epulopiscium sp.]|nr:precorrin-8X methylmutase [Candidatus Epulonipiscium sp.]